MIKPGSFVRLPKRKGGRPAIFTTWVRPKGKRITKFAAISGDTKGMVHPDRGIPVTVNDGDAFFAVEGGPVCGPEGRYWWQIDYLGVKG